MRRTSPFLRLVITGIMMISGYLHTIAQPVINLEPDTPSGIAALVKQTNAKAGYDPSSKTWYTVYNDAGAIYIQLLITDTLQQKKVIENGVEIWIDAKAKKKKSTGIVFPLAATSAEKGTRAAPAPLPGNQQPIEKKEMREQLKRLLLQKNEMQLTGFKEELNGIQNIRHPSGLQVSLQFSNDTLIYQAVVPFVVFAKAPAMNMPVSIGIIEKGILSAGFNGNGMPDFGEPPGEGMMPPPGLPPGEEQSGEEDMHQLLEDNVIWYKFVLKKNF